jgi:hypothetical protein
LPFRLCPCISSRACDITRWPILIIHHLTRCATVFFSTWHGTCRCVVLELSPVIVCFLFFLSFLKAKVHHCSFCCLILIFSPHSFNFLFHSYSFYRCFFQSSPSIIICVYDVFRFSPYTFDFLFFSIGFFLSKLL